MSSISELIAVKDSFENKPAKDIFFDFSKLKDIDAVSIGLLIDFLNEQRSRGKLLKIEKASKYVKKVLKLNELAQHFNLEL